jgi:iron complex outermembrane receptor protein
MPVPVFVFVLFALLLPGAIPALHAQPASGTVRGTVLSAERVPLPGARVTLAGSGHAAVTGADGAFVLDGVPAGRWTVRAERLGHAPAERGVEVRAGEAAAVTLELPVRSVALEGIEVTTQRRRTASATRTETELLDIPQSIQVVGQDVIRRQAVLDLEDAVRNVSGVTFTGTYNGGYQYFSSRGFFMSNVSNYRRNGVLLPNFGQNYADNVESVEVLKGPAGILYGDVTPGGIINVVTKKPQPVPYRRAEVKLGSYGLVRPSVDLTGPLNGSGTLLGRVNASYERSESFRDVVNSEGWMVAPALIWAPSPRTTWTVEGSLRQDDRVGDPGLLSPDGTVAGLRRLPISRFLGEAEATYGYQDRTAVSSLEQRLGGAWTLRHTAAYGWQTRTPLNIYLRDADEAGNVTRQQYYFHQVRGTWSTALDLAGEITTGPVRHRVLVGADWMQHRSHTGRAVEENLPGAINLFDPAYGEQAFFDVPGEMDPTALYTWRTGVYAQNQASVWGDRLHLLLGVRWNGYRSGLRDVETGGREGEDTRERPLTPRLGVVVKPAPWLSAYGSYAESYEVTGFDWIDPTVAVPPTFGRQWEAGLKGDFFAQRLGVTLSAFRIRKSDVYGWANYTPENPAPDAESAERGWYTYSGASHQSRGIELDFNGRVSDRLLLTGSAALIEAEIVEDPAYASGNRLANTPRESVSLWATYQPGGVLRGADFGTGVFYKGDFYGSDDNAPGGLVEADYTMDAAAGYEWGAYRAQLNVTNLTDRRSFLGGFGLWEPLWPRRVVLTLSTRF